MGLEGYFYPYNLNKIIGKFGGADQLRHVANQQ